MPLCQPLPMNSHKKTTEKYKTLSVSCAEWASSLCCALTDHELM